MIAFDVEGEKYYAFEKINPQSQQQQDVYTFPHIDFDPDSNCALKHLWRLKFCKIMVWQQDCPDLKPSLLMML